MTLSMPHFNALPTTIDLKIFSVTGYQARTSNQLEFNPSTAKIAPLWQSFFASPLFMKGIPYGIYSDYESGVHEMYTVTAGIEAVDFSVSAPSTITIPAGRYLCFRFEGDLPQASIQGWIQVWNYFQEPGCAYKRLFVVDFEKYVSEKGVEIYIGIE